MSDAGDFSKFVPGFDFLQTLAQGAGAAMPAFGQWVAPTLDPDEIDKRIKELRTVQFWLEQNSRLLATTIQALEVQRMTLSTLKTMNVQMGDLRESLKVRIPGAPTVPAAPASLRSPPPSPAPAPAAEAAAPSPRAKAKDATGAAAVTGAVDPTQWWNALTQQFAQIASTAMKGSPAEAAAAMTAGLTSPERAVAAKPAPAKRKTPRRRAAAKS